MENTITETVAAPVQIRTADQETPAIAGVSFLVLTKRHRLLSVSTFFYS